MTGPVLRFVKGHGTENDFVLLPDPEARLDLTPAVVRALCDRRAGLGADGVLRVVPAALHPDAAAMAEQAEWFMDHRNADGSLAEMCGNGIRLFARYLIEAGLASGDQVIATRSGVRRVEALDDGWFGVDMGPVRLLDERAATVGGTVFPGRAVCVGNPHLVCVTDVPVASLDLHSAPAVTGFSEGVNVEFVNVNDEGARLRVHERGVGETRACGTGAAAVGAVVLARAGNEAGTVSVDQPGGRVLVTVAEGTAYVAGPAVIVGGGELDPGWLALLVRGTVLG